MIYGDEENERFYDEHYFRKQELRELKLLQKQEQKQFQDLAFKNQVGRRSAPNRRLPGFLIRLYKSLKIDGAGYALDGDLANLNLEDIFRFIHLKKMWQNVMGQFPSSLPVGCLIG